MTKAVILARVSTVKQEREGLSLKEIQLPVLRDYVQSKGLTVEKEFVFSETADSKIRRKFDEMVKYVKENEDIKAIVAYRVDRITRNFRDAVLVDELLQDYGKEIHFVHDRLVIDKDTVGMGIFAWDTQVYLAKQYLNRLKEDARNSASLMLRNGLLPGNAPYGYWRVVMEDKKKWVVVEPFKAKVVQKMYEWYGLGCYSMLQVRDKLKEDFNLEFSKGYIDAILKNPFYAGNMLYAGKEYPHKYECIISRELFDKVQEIKAGYNKKHSKYAGLPYAYRGLIKCSDCGCAITPERKKDRYIYYHCTQYHGNHDAEWLREEEITSQFAEIYKSLQIPQNIIEEITTSLRKSHQDKTQFHRTLLDSYHSEYQKLEARIEKMYEDKLDGSITESFYDKKREEYRSKQQEITDKISKLGIADEEYYLTSEYLLQLASRSYELFMSSEAEEKRQLLKLTLQNLELEGKKLKFEFVKPFDKVFACSSRQRWLGIQDSNLA
ncbi:MAG TPA: recombinase family protein [Dehalococcoidia bacterium]|nr:recombinase family protein [Dehalococcoidia bacterium]